MPLGRAGEGCEGLAVASEAGASVGVRAAGEAAPRDALPPGVPSGVAGAWGPPFSRRMRVLCSKGVPQLSRLLDVQVLRLQPCLLESSGDVAPSAVVMKTWHSGSRDYVTASVSHHLTLPAPGKLASQVSQYDTSL